MDFSFIFSFRVLLRIKVKVKQLYSHYTIKCTKKTRGLTGRLDLTAHRISQLSSSLFPAVSSCFSSPALTNNAIVPRVGKVTFEMQ